MARRMAGWAVAAAVAAGGGCVSGPTWLSTPKTVPTPKATDWQAQATGEIPRVSVTREAFAARVGELLRDGRRTTAKLYVERFPDVALDALRVPPTGTPPDVLAFVEQCHDAQCGAGVNWPERRKAAAPAGNIVLATKVMPQEADGAIKHVKALDGTAAAIDAGRVGALAHLAAEQPTYAEAAVVSAYHAPAVTVRPYEDIPLSLLLAEAKRRGGREIEPATALWVHAVEVAASLLEQTPAVADPVLWEKLAFARPVPTAWPAKVRAATAKFGAAAAVAGLEGVSDEAVLWAAVGTWRLDRNEPQAALTAFKKAETAATNPDARNRLKVWQARALVAADQTPIATALLAPLAGSPKPGTAAPAAAVLGAIKLQAGAVKQARTLLEQADAVQSDWPGKPDAVADLGLALILDGDDAKGLDKLREAEARFTQAGDVSGLMRLLRNEADYWDGKGDPRAESIRQRVKQIEAGS